MPDYTIVNTMIDFLIYHRINALSISDIYSCDDRLFIAVNLLFSIGNFIFVKKISQ